MARSKCDFRLPPRHALEATRRHGRLELILSYRPRNYSMPRLIGVFPSYSAIGDYLATASRALPAREN